MDDDLEKPGLPFWLWLVIAAFAVLGAVTLVKWVFVTLLGLVKLAIVVAVVVLVIAGLRSLARKH